MKLFEEFKLYENLFEDTAAGKEHPWMKDVPLVYPELNMCSNPDDPEDDMLIKDFTYLEGPEDVAEVLGDLITEEDVAGTGYDFQTIKTDCDAWYDFLDANFDKLVTKYDEELLNAFEDSAREAAVRDAENYSGLNESISNKEIVAVLKDARETSEDFGITDEFTFEYYIGNAVSAACYPMDSLFMFLPDHVSDNDKEYKDAVRGWLENEGLTQITEASNESYNTKDLKESYRRTVSRGNTLANNPLFVDFD